MNDYFDKVTVSFPATPVGQVVVRVIPFPKLFDKQLMKDAVNAWDTLGKKGAFCHSHQLPEQASTSVEWILQGRIHELHLNLRNCDNRCLLVLANALIDAGYLWNDALEEVEIMYNSIDISTPGYSGTDTKRYSFNSAEFELKDQDYPESSNIMKEKVFFEYTGSAKSFRRVLVEFNTASAEDRYDTVVETAELWGSVIQNGYPFTMEELHEGYSAIKDIDVDIFDESSLEISVETYGGSEAAWDAFINMLGVMRSGIHQITIY